MTKGRWIAAGISVALAAVVSGCSGSDQPDLSYPASQREFSSLNSKCKANYAEGLNDIQKSLAFNQCNKDRLRFARERKISGWVGEITDISTDQGAEVVSVTLNTTIDSFGMSFGTVNNRISDYATDSMITQANPLFNVLAQMKEGDLVSFDATFLPHPENARGVWESSMTEQGSMDEPEFSVRFADIRPYRAESKAVATSVDAVQPTLVDAPQPSEPEFQSDGGDSSDASETDCNDPQNQIEMNLCAAQELDAETAAINSVYKRYRATLSVSEQQKLKEEELAWIKSKDATCEEKTSDVAGGSAHSQVLADCLIERTKAQRRHIEELSRCREEASSGDRCLPADNSDSVTLESDAELASLNGMAYGDGKRLLKKAGYKLDPYIDSGIFTLAFDGDPASCGNAGCSMQWVLPHSQQRICVNTHIDERLPESKMLIAVVKGECE